MRASLPQLLPFVDKYLAAVEKRARASEEPSPIKAPAKKAVRAPSPEEKRFDLVLAFVADSSDKELEALHILLTKEIEKRIKPPAGRFFDTRVTSGGACSSR